MRCLLCWLLAFDAKRLQQRGAGHLEPNCDARTHCYLNMKMKKIRPNAMHTLHYYVTCTQAR